MFLFFLSLLLSSLTSSRAYGDSLTIYKADIKGVINPVTLKYISSVFERAKWPDSIVLITIDTPGGLVSSMRSIVQDILNSSTPVIAYVYPRGARAASAGTFILLSSSHSCNGSGNDGWGGVIPSL